MCIPNESKKSLDLCYFIVSFLSISNFRSADQPAEYCSCQNCSYTSPHYICIFIYLFNVSPTFCTNELQEKLFFFYIVPFEQYNCCFSKSFIDLLIIRPCAWSRDNQCGLIYSPSHSSPHHPTHAHYVVKHTLFHCCFKNKSKFNQQGNCLK